MSKDYDKKYGLTPFAPDILTSEGLESYIVRAENMWLRFNEKKTYAQGYTGHKNINETPDTVTLTGTLTWTDDSKEIVGSSGTSFNLEIREGNFIFANTGDNTRQLLVVEEVVNDALFIATSIPTVAGTSTSNKIMPVIFPVGGRRGTCVMGNVVKFPKGQFLGVGAGEFKLDGLPLNNTLDLTKQPQFALYDVNNDLYTANDVGIDLPGAEPIIALAAVAGTSPMRAGAYNIRVYSYNTETLGHSQPSEVIAPVTLTAGQQIKIDFIHAMQPDQNAYIILGTEFVDNSTANVEARYMGPWYKVKILKTEDLIDGAHPTGKEAGTTHTFSYPDSAINFSNQIISFDNFTPKEAEFVTLLNGIPIYFSCLGKGTGTKKEGRSPGPCGIPSKPSNPEAVFLNKVFTTTDSDTILGMLNARGRIFVLCQNSLQNVILTTIDVEPIAFRSFWKVGFRNPFNICFYKEYLQGFSIQGFIRGAAAGDSMREEVGYAMDLREYTKDLDCGKALVEYDPKNKAICHFFAAYDQRSGYWTTLVIPFLVEAGVFSYPIILSKENQDFIVSGVATVGQSLYMIAGGMSTLGVFTVGTYEFDGGDSEDRDWNITYCYSADDMLSFNKNFKKASILGKFSDDVSLKMYSVAPDKTFDMDALFAGTGATLTQTIADTGGILGLKNFNFTDAPNGLYNTIRIEGTHSAPTVDELHGILMKLESNSSEV